MKIQSFVTIVAFFFTLSLGALRAETESIRVGQDNLTYQRVGQGRALVLLHGTPGSHKDWGQLVEQFSGYELFLLDRPGHGNSTNEGHDYTLGCQAELVAGFIHEMSLQNVGLIGHSYGGSVAMQIAADHPDLVSSVALIASPLFRHAGRSLIYSIPDIPLIGGALLWWPGARLAERGLRKKFFSKPKMAAFADEHMKGWMEFSRLREMFGELANLDRGLRRLTPNIEQLDLPILYLAGDEESVYMDIGKKLQQTLRGVRFESVASGHYPQVEQTEQTARILQEFMADSTSP